MEDKKIIFISFGGPTINYHNSLTRIRNEAKNTNIFDKIIPYTDIDLKNDKEFWEKHGHFIENNLVGYGFWIWKSYINWKTIQNANNNDIICYADAGCTMSAYGNKSFKRYIEIIEKSKYGLLGFELGNMEKKYTKMDLFKFMDLDTEKYMNTNQICATAFIYKKCEHTISFMKEWYNLSSNHDLISDLPNNMENDKIFIEHRRDQSIFSLLCKKYGAELLIDVKEFRSKNDFIQDTRNRDGPDPKKLNILAQIYNTDKLTHGFIDIYINLFNNLYHSQFNFLEIGVFFGASIKMWSEYFIGATIYGADFFKGIQGNGHKFDNADSFYKEWSNNRKKYPNIELFILDQSKENELQQFVNFCNQNNIKFKVILDDASHLMHDQQISFFHLFDLLDETGFYIIEDIHTSDQINYDVLPDNSNSTKLIFKNMQNGSNFNSIYIQDKDKCNTITNQISNIEFHFIKSGSETLSIHKK